MTHKIANEHLMEHMYHHREQFPKDKLCERMERRMH